ncbi:MAG TPA: hypothetical protein VIK55_04120, partial [Paludibacter sp.]
MDKIMKASVRDRTKMKTIVKTTFSLFLVCTFLISCIQELSNKQELNTRDPLKWPFASNSIWNMPIGSKAVYV